MPQAMLLWPVKPDGTSHPHRATAPVAFHAGELIAWPDRTAVDQVWFVPDVCSDVVGALLVPDSATQAVSRAGLRLRPGMHPLRHADSLQIGAAALWVSAEGTPDRTTYDPNLHGSDVFCARTKARLKVGDAIVICPGIPTVSCGLVYKATAWTPQLACPRCKFDPQQAPWAPPRHYLLEPSHDLIARIRRKPR